MKNYAKEFLFRGLIFSGLGPIVLGIVYAILQVTIEGFSLGGYEVLLGIISTYLLAFIQAGATVFNQIESWSIGKSLLCHFSLLFVAYSLAYILNSWIPFEPIVLAIFAGIFIISYLLIWSIVFLIVKGTSKRLNAMLS